MHRIPAGLQKSLERMLLIKRQFDPDANIIGFALGKKIRNGISTGEDAITVFVQRKVLDWPYSADDRRLPINPWVPLKDNLSDKELFNFEHEEKIRREDLAHLPPAACIWTDIVQTPVPEFQANSGNYRKSMPGGISIGLARDKKHPGTTGTLGCFVRNAVSSAKPGRNGREFYLLSAGHVLDGFQQAPHTDVICQPGEEDQTQPNKAMNYGIGMRIETTGVYLQPNNPQSFDVDAGIARPVSFPQVANSAPTYNDGCVEWRLLSFGGFTGVATAKIGLRVKKVGRTTAVTYGEVTHLSASFDVNYKGQKAIMNSQIITTMMSKPGDSGSILLDDANQVVGLVIAGDDEKTVATPISSVLGALDVELY